MNNAAIDDIFFSPGCETFADCGPNAECDFADWLGANICFCRAGFFGDGVNCSVATTVAVLCKGSYVRYDVMTIYTKSVE